MRRLTIAGVAAVFLAGCAGDDSGGWAGAPFKSDAELEREIADSLDQRPYNELLFTPLSIDCPGISDNLKGNKPTRCFATDARGNSGSFTVDAVSGGDYEFRPSEVVTQLSFR